MSNWLRVSIGTQPETETFLAVLRQIVPAQVPSLPSLKFLCIC
jgi:hypothetical protein